MGKPQYKLRVPDGVADLVRKMHPHLKKKVKESLRIIMSDPDAGKVLKEKLAGLRSFRVSRFRIIYRIASDKQIELVAVGPRDRIYEETFRIIKRESKI